MTSRKLLLSFFLLGAILVAGVALWARDASAKTFLVERSGNSQASTAPTQSSGGYCYSNECYYYLARWEWYTSYWQAPGGDALGLLDLRPLPAQTKAGGTPEGWGFFVYATPHDICLLGCAYRGVEVLRRANALDTELSPLLISAIETRLGVDLTATTVRGILWELFTLRGDPTGLIRWKPLRMGSDGVVRLYLGGHSLIKSAEGRETTCRWEWVWLDSYVDEPGYATLACYSGFSNTIAVFQADYRRNKEDGLPLEALRRWTGSTMLALWGRTGDDLAQVLLPLEYAADGWRPPRTTLGDTFVEAANTVLASHTATGPNGGFSWSEMQGAMTVIAGTDTVQSVTNGDAFSRADSDLSSDDHYAQITFKAVTGGTGSEIGPTVRKDSTATLTYYGYRAINNAARLYKEVNDILTFLGTAYSFTRAANDVIYVSADGSTLDGRINGTSQSSATDTAITGYFRPGIRMNNPSTGRSIDGDDLLAEDIAAPTPTPTPSAAPWVIFFCAPSPSPVAAPCLAPKGLQLQLQGQGRD